MNTDAKKKISTVITDTNGMVLSFKVEEYEWNPVKFARHVGVGRSKSSQTIIDMKVGEIKKITHPDVICKTRHYTTNNKKQSRRSCSLLSVITKLRKEKHWQIEQYHEADHIIVVRRLA